MCCPPEILEQDDMEEPEQNQPEADAVPEQELNAEGDVVNHQQAAENIIHNLLQMMFTMDNLGHGVPPYLYERFESVVSDFAMELVSAATAYDILSGVYLDMAAYFYALP